MDDDANAGPAARQPPGGPVPPQHAGHGMALPAGTRLAEFELQRVLGEGGFGIVYLAWDHSLERQVALKEYLPAALAGRAGAGTVLPHSERHRETFELGLRSFVNEAKALAQFDHPSLVKVYRFWEAQGTAYMVMPFYQGRTVKDTVRAMAARPGEDWLLALLVPLAEALAVVHAEQWFHRDIAPDNILLLADGGRPLLLDFGAARRVIGDHTQNLTVILKAGYAPIEQYAEMPGMRQGAWTDVYALAAVAYWVITGETPPASIGRMVSDTLQPAAQVAAGRYSPQLLAAIDQALALRPDQRTRSMQAFRAALGGARGVAAAAAAPPPVDAEATVIRPARGGEARPAATLAGPAPDRVPPAAAAAPARRRAWPVLAGAAGLGAVVVAGLLAWPQAPVPTQVPVLPTPSGTPAPSPRPTPAPDPASPPAPATTAPPAAPVAPAFVPAAAPAPAPAPTTATAPPTRPQPSGRATSSSKPAAPGPNPVPALARPAAKATGDQAECAQVLQRLSLGDTAPELQERLKTLRCK